MKTIVAGSRTFNDYELLENTLKEHEITEIVSGTARGADSLGEDYGIKYNIPIVKFPPNWDKYGKSAGYIRNLEMARYAEACIVFWDGKSKGSLNMIKLATKNNLHLTIIG